VLELMKEGTVLWQMREELDKGFRMHCMAFGQLLYGKDGMVMVARRLKSREGPSAAFLGVENTLRRILWYMKLNCLLY
jgi:hypothetical protein